MKRRIGLVLLLALFVLSPLGCKKEGGKSSTSGGESQPGSVTVYVTRTGAKYHRAGCRYLSKSQIRMPLEEAKKRYAPCKVCNPPE